MELKPATDVVMRSPGLNMILKRRNGRPIIYWAGVFSTVLSHNHNLLIDNI